jgi:hypothetical protein
VKEPYSNESVPRPLRRPALALGLWLVILLHLFLVLREYPPSLLVQAQVPARGDVTRYFATVYGFSQVSGLFGYDPAFMAGYPVGLWNSMGKKGYEMFNLFFPWIPLPILFYLVLAGFAFAGPLILWWSLRSLCPTPRCSVALLVLALVFWDLSSEISYFWGFGNVGYPLACALVPAMTVLAWKLAETAGRRVLGPSLLLGVLAAVVSYVHTVVLLAALPRWWRRWRCAARRGEDALSGSALDWPPLYGRRFASAGSFRSWSAVGIASLSRKCGLRGR